jgi:hypothetical protein
MSQEGWYLNVRRQHCFSTCLTFDRDVAFINLTSWTSQSLLESILQSLEMETLTPTQPRTLFKMVYTLCFTGCLQDTFTRETFEGVIKVFPRANGLRLTDLPESCLHDILYHTRLVPRVTFHIKIWNKRFPNKPYIGRCLQEVRSPMNFLELRSDTITNLNGLFTHALDVTNVTIRSDRQLYLAITDEEIQGPKWTVNRLDIETHDRKHHSFRDLARLIERFEGLELVNVTALWMGMDVTEFLTPYICQQPSLKQLWITGIPLNQRSQIFAAVPSIEYIGGLEDEKRWKRRRCLFALTPTRNRISQSSIRKLPKELIRKVGDCLL